jgi:putative phosphoesterase
MKIVVVSDTHKDFHVLKQVVDANLDADLFIHLGDGQHEFIDMQNLYMEKQFVFVLGNSDFGTAKTDRIVTLGGHKIFCTHGHLYGVHFGVKKLVEKAKLSGCEIALYGHTHIFSMKQTEGVYVMNPGSLESPRGKNPPTYGVIELSEGSRIEMNIVAIEK